MWLLLACVAPPLPPVIGGDTARGETGPVDTAPVDTGPVGDTSDTGETSPYVGDVLDPPLAPPLFAVLDQGGAWRTEADLLGHPTVLWFFREAEGAT